MSSFVRVLGDLRLTRVGSSETIIRVSSITLLLSHCFFLSSLYPPLSTSFDDLLSSTFLSSLFHFCIHFFFRPLLFFTTFYHLSHFLLQSRTPRLSALARVPILYSSSFSLFVPGPRNRQPVIFASSSSPSCPHIQPPVHLLSFFSDVRFFFTPLLLCPTSQFPLCASPFLPYHCIARV